MRILVTGSSGFIGSHLCPALTTAGHTLGTTLEGCNVVVHLANIAHTSASADALRRVNFEGTIAQAAAARAAGAQRFIYLSSIKAAKPEDAYGRAKADAEQALLRMDDLATTIFRPPLVYGPRVKANFLALVRAVDRGWPMPLASVTNRRSLVYVANLVDAIQSCLEAPRAAGKVYEVGDGDAVSTPELIRALARALGRSARLFPFPPGLLDLLPPLRPLVRSLEVEDSAIRRELGWRPPFTFEQGLRATAEWYLAQAR